MKVRIHDQYLRFRLDEQEVRHLSQGEPVRTGVGIAESSITFELQVAQIDFPTLRVSSGSTEICIPQSWVGGWEQSDTVGFEWNLDSGRDTAITVVVEKDYPCAHTKEGKAVFGRPVIMSKQA